MSRVIRGMAYLVFERLGNDEIRITIRTRARTDSQTGNCHVGVFEL